MAEEQAAAATRLLELLTWVQWLVAGTLPLLAAVIVLEGARWWTVGLLVLGVIVLLDVVRLRRRFANRNGAAS